MSRRATAALLLALAAGPAHAASCQLAVVGLDFGNVPQLNPAPVDTQASVSVTCTAAPEDLQGAIATIDYAIAIGPGQSGNALVRSMTAPGSGNLPYGVYLDPAYATVWGDGTNGTAQASGQFTFTVIDTSANLPRSSSHIAYGRIPAGSAAATGSYADTLVVTVSF